MSTNYRDPRSRWKIFFPVIVLDLGLTTWLGLSFGSSTGQTAMEFLNLSKAPESLLPPYVASAVSVGLFALTGFSALFAWNRIVVKGESPILTRGPIIAFSLILPGVIAVLATVGILYDHRLAAAIGFMLISILSFSIGGAVVGVIISFVPHVTDYLRDFKTDYILMAAVPTSGILLVAIPCRWINKNMMFWVSLLIVFVFMIVIVIIFIVLHKQLLRLRRSFIEELTFLFRSQNRRRTTPEPQAYDSEPRPIRSAVSTIRLARPFPSIFSMILAAHFGAFQIATWTNYDFIKFGNGSNFTEPSACLGPYVNVDIALFLLCLPACFVPLAVHHGFFKQDAAGIIQPICAVVVAVGLPLAQYCFGELVLDLKDCSVSWGLLVTFIVISCFRSALVAAAYIDLLYQVYLAAGDLAMPAGTGAIAMGSGSTGVLLGALNTLIMPDVVDLSSLAYAVPVFALPVCMTLAVIGTIVWRRCKPIAIEY